MVGGFQPDKVHQRRTAQTAHLHIAEIEALALEGRRADRRQHPAIRTVVENRRPGHRQPAERPGEEGLVRRQPAMGGVEQRAVT